MELLAPGGDADSLRAAAANGADAVYFGLSNFNARHRAGSAAGESLRDQVKYLHDHNVRAYVAFNTLIFSDELQTAAQCIADIAASGADAVIVQDLGLARLLKAIAPSLPLHGSTQMTLTDARGIEFVRRLGIERVILARELSIADIARITAATSLPVEVFVHGALCVSYSGQCLTSESLGGRSANRGQCAQACRLPYELVVDGKTADTRGRSYLLSPQDLAAYDLVARLRDAGVAALKIEGRLKSAQYVAATTRAYRDAVDAAQIRRPFTLPRNQQEQLTQSFSRGFTHGFLDGVNHQKLAPGTFSKKRGIQVGRVVSSSEEGVTVQLLPGQSLKAGDGIVFDEGHPEQDEQGGRIYSVQAAGPGRIELRFMRTAIRCDAVSDDCLVWKTDDPRIFRELSQTFSRDVLVRREPLDATVFAAQGQLLRIILCDQRGNTGSAVSPLPLERAQKHPLDEKTLRDQLGRLGSTPFELGELRLVGRDEASPPDAVMAPKSVLNEVRRLAVEALLAMRLQQESHAVTDPGALQKLRQVIAREHPAGQCSREQAQLAVLVRSMPQLEAVLRWSRSGRRASMVYCDFEDIRFYPQAVEAAQRRAIPIALATMRICKTGEEGFLKLIGDAAPDAVLVRSLSALSYFREFHPSLPLIGDYSLNVANDLTADLLLASGLCRLCPSYDLNWLQLSAMLVHIGGSGFEAVLHQQMPMFHMEHCVFAAMLSQGKDYRDCGRPCEKHRVWLRDRRGVQHPLVADAGCRNTVFNGRAQSAAEYAGRMLAQGIAWYRVELLQEDASAAISLLNYYADILAGDAASAMKLKLPVLTHFGVTPGTIEFD